MNEYFMAFVLAPKEFFLELPCKAESHKQVSAFLLEATVPKGFSDMGLALPWDSPDHTCPKLLMDKGWGKGGVKIPGSPVKDTLKAL